VREYSNYILIDNTDGSAEIVIDHPLFMEDQNNLHGRFDRSDLIITNADGDSVCMKDVYRGEWMAAYYIVQTNSEKEARRRTPIEI